MGEICEQCKYLQFEPQPAGLLLQFTLINANLKFNKTGGKKTKKKKFILQMQIC